MGERNESKLSVAEMLALGDLLRRGYKHNQINVSIDRQEGPTFTIRSVDVVLEGEEDDGPEPTVDIFI